MPKGTQPSPETMSREDLIYEVEHWREVYLREGKDVQAADEFRLAFSVAEERILQTLWECRGRILSRDFLLDQCFPANTDIVDRTVDSYIKRIRRKLEATGVETQIKTSYGRGYYVPADQPDPFSDRRNQPSKTQKG